MASDAWSIRAGGVFLQRDEVVRPRREHWRDNTPALFRFVSANREGSIAVEHVQQHLTVGGQFGRFEVGGQGQRNELACTGTDTGQFDDLQLWGEQNP